MVPRHALLFITALIILLILLSTVRAQYGVDEIPGFGNVPYINLARGARITATATCGEDQFGRPRSELYCKLVGGPTNGPHSQTIEGQFCDICNSNDPNKAHPVTNAIDGTERWWQSPPLSRGLEYNEVNITLDLGQLYHVAYVLIKFGNSPRPDLWVLERSVDNGRTYTPWQYFAHSRRDCIEKFGKQPNAPIVCDNDQICSTEYSRIVPFENGEIVVSLVNGRPGSRDFARAPLLQEFTKASSIRLRFLRTSTLLGHLISKAQRDPTVTRRYFYSIKDISVGGRSVSYSQAQLPQNPDAGNQERIGEYVNRCVPCSCNGLSNECEEATGKCLNCQYNTAGDRCERCKDGHYGDPARRTCRMCPCPFAVESNNFATGCRQVADGFQCLCKPGYTGDRCERCAPGYYGEPLANGGSCRPCNCNGNDCDQRTGVCNNPVEPEPGDSNMEEQCSECDNCAQELLKDLEKLDEELIRIKGLLERSGTSSAAKQRLKELNELIRKTERLIKEFSSEVNTQEKRVDRMKLEVLNLEDDINSLKQQAEKSSQNAQDAVNKAEDTHQKARDLDNEARDLLKKIQELLKKLKDATTGEVIVPSEDLADLLEKATKMVNEMEARDFAPQKTLAEDEKKEAQKLLDHIRNNVNKQMEENKKAAEKVQGLLDGYKAKLKDLEEKLKEANDLVKTANNQNSINTRSMDDLLKRIKALEQERDKVAGQIDMAKKQLKDTGDLLNMLADSKKEYEELAAQLDGAKKDVIRKLNDISRVEGLKDLVKRAEDHAENLSKLAKELQDAVQSSSGNADVQNAIAAIDAYKNIVDAVNAADEAAKEAKDAAEKALNQVNQEDLTARAKKLKDNANSLLKDAEQGEKDLKLASEDLTDQKKRLEDAKKKKDELERDHRAVLEGLKDIQRGDTADLIDAAKRAAASAQETNRKTLGRLDTIKDELDKINLKPTDSNIDKVLNEVDKSVKNLSNTIPSLIDKISEIEQLSSELGPSKNVTDNINRIKELIEQARDAANRVVVPMRFEGDGYVELRAPKNLDDLKAYTDLSLTLQRPLSRLDKRSARYSRQATPGNLFVMYLGNRNVPNDYLGMVVKQDVLYFVYKLNGREYEIPTTEITRSATEPAIFDKVDVHRIYQDAEVKYTRSFTSNDPYPAETKTVMGSLGQNLLDLDPNEVVFYVGGYPSNFTPPASLNHPNYKGCIEFSTFNEQDLSLYNFKNAVNINKVTPCTRYAPQEVSDFFEGTGYGKVPFAFSTRSNILSQNVQTRSENGLLLFIGNEESYWSISLDKGYVVVTSKNATSTEPRIQKSTSKYPALSGEVKVAIINQKLTVIVNSNSVITTPFLAGTLDHYYIGGLPQSLRERVSITTLPFKGCMSNVKANNKYMVYMETLGVGKGCPVDLLGSRKAEFSLGCALQSPPGDFSLTGDVSLSLGFRSNKTDGVLFQNSQAGTGIELSMVDGYVVLKYNGIWKSNKQYQDGKWHYLTVTKEGPSMSLRIDEEDEGQKQANSVSLGPEPKDIVLGKDTFKGCLSNLYMRRSLYRPEDLSTFTSSGDILLDVCSA